VIGNPLGFFRVANRATFLGTAVLEGTSTEVLVIRGPVYKGNSGSPVINSEGEVIGVIFATSTDTKSDEIIAFAIPVAEIFRQVEAIGP
jgi:S1-C subfamily serine protease